MSIKITTSPDARSQILILYHTGLLIESSYLTGHGQHNATISCDILQSNRVLVEFVPYISDIFGKCHVRVECGPVKFKLKLFLIHCVNSQFGPQKLYSKVETIKNTYKTKINEMSYH